MNWVWGRCGAMARKTAARAKLQAWLVHNVVKELLFVGARFGTCVEAVLLLKIFDAEVMIYCEGFTRWSGTAGAETQCLYYAEVKIIVDCVELKKERLEEEVK